ncbi:MAG: class I SAM-dependent DNA methyltransferase, partial [Acidobacteria bacterium]|nr:class I SAM-dependent DNA methyltransferase [Acidobacteriota bacterium]
AGVDDDPRPLLANAGKSFIGSYVLGMGFTFDDSDKKGVANPIALMHELIRKDPRNAERIFPYIGGEEVNDSPTHAHHRYVINFAQMSEDEARRWPDLLRIVEARVKPERQLLGDNPDGRRRKAYWWQWGRYTPALFEAIRDLDRVLAVAQISQTFGFTFLQPSVYSHKLVLFPFRDDEALALMQSRVHESWARFYGSSFKDDLTYTPSECFETFPFPDEWRSNQSLGDSGREYHAFRKELMIRTNEGLTDTSNRFHDREFEHDPDIVKLRDLHAAMDRAVLDAYGWTDIQPTCEFILDYEDDADDTDGQPSKKKKPWRYRWPDEIRDEVLGRLLELNAQRARGEASAKATEAGAAKVTKTKGARGASTPLLDP